MIDRKNQLSINRQAQLLEISRGSVYYRPKPVRVENLALMRQIDELHLEHPFMGARMLRDQLSRIGSKVGRKHVSTLMKKMGIEALYRKPRTSKKHPEHAVYPYLLRGKVINRANHVWALDTTYIPMAQGYVYLTAVVDWASRKVLAARIAITLEAVHAVEVLQDAFSRYGKPEIINTDQGSQFTAYEFVQAVKSRGVSSAWMDAVPGGTIFS
jgi:putative transposase